MASCVKYLLFVFIAYQFPNTNGKKRWYCENRLETSRFNPEKYIHALEKTAIFTLKNRVCDSSRALQARTHIAGLNVFEIPEVSSQAELESIFKYMRDTKFIIDSSGAPRRISWLYPDDGCYRRAELAAREIFAAGMKVPKKIFVAGEPDPIKVQTVNKAGGQVQWRYHVALIYRLGKDAFVMDPSMEARRPLSLHEWHSAMGGGDNLKYSICLPTTYGIRNKCHKLDLYVDDMYAKQIPLLVKERRRLKQLGRDPKEELGHNPPWLTKDL